MVMTQTKTNHQNILIVEDDEDTAEVVSTLLQKEGFTTTAVEYGEDALEKIANLDLDLVVLDINLPDMSGLDILRIVRTNSSLPMIILSGFGKDREKVVALEQGADDYVGKPFSPEELIARIRALLRRVEWTPEPDTRLQVRQLYLDMPKRQAMIREKRLHLTPTEYGILVILMQNVGKPISHDDLLKAVWGDTYKDDYSVLRVNISRLRYKLEENPRNPMYIVTVPGKGYIMPSHNV